MLKKHFFTFALMLIASLAWAQAPQKFNYQGIARDVKGNPVATQTLAIKLSVLPAMDATVPEYEETQMVTTNEFGLYTLQIGNGTAITGEMKLVKWETGNKYIRVAIDPNGGDNYIDAGTTQLLSVPYAIYADKAGIARETANGTEKTRSGTVSTSAAGTGTTNYLTKFVAANTIANSQLWDNGNTLIIGNPASTSANNRFHIYTNNSVQQTYLRLENVNVGGTGRFLMTNDGANSYATFTKYGNGIAGNYGGNPLYPNANLLAFGNNGSVANDGTGRFLITNGGNIGLAITKTTGTTVKFHADFASGNVSLGGNAAPATNVHINNSVSGDTLKITNSTTGHLATDGLEIRTSGNAAAIINEENSTLDLGTNNAVNVRIDANGNVGIGTTTPTTNLDINGQIRIQGGAPGVGKVLTSDATGLATWQVPSGGGGSGSGWGLTGNAGTNSGTNFIGTSDNASLSLRTNNTLRMEVDSLGRVGIATNNPKVLLHVNRGSFDEGIRLEGNGAWMGFADSNASYSDYIMHADGGMEMGTSYGTSRNIRFAPYGNTMIMADTARIGLGTSAGNPTYRVTLQADTTLGQNGIFINDILGGKAIVAEKSGNAEVAIFGKSNLTSNTPALYCYVSSGNGTAAAAFDGGINTIDYSSNNSDNGVYSFSYRGKAVVGVADSNQSGVFTSGNSNAIANALTEGVLRGQYVGTAAQDYVGVYGYSKPVANQAKGIGLKGIGGYAGIIAMADASAGSKRAVSATASNTGSTNYGVWAEAYGATTNWAGYFSGQLYATSSSAGVKAFMIDHPLDPENKYLRHSSIESNDMMNIYNGNIQTDANGYATITLPDYFEALNENFKYQLTVLDNSSDFVMSKVTREVSNNSFEIRTSKPNVKVSWQVSGVRHDATAQKYPIVIEEMKPQDLRGKYMVPEAYGKSKEFGVSYESDHQQAHSSSDPAYLAEIESTQAKQKQQEEKAKAERRAAENAYQAKPAALPSINSPAYPQNR